jgi:hypothetical protein
MSIYRGSRGNVDSSWIAGDVDLSWIAGGISIYREPRRNVDLSRTAEECRFTANRGGMGGGADGDGDGDAGTDADGDARRLCQEVMSMARPEGDGEVIHFLFGGLTAPQGGLTTPHVTLARSPLEITVWRGEQLLPIGGSNGPIILIEIMPQGSTLTISQRPPEPLTPSQIRWIHYEGHPQLLLKFRDHPTTPWSKQP